MSPVNSVVAIVVLLGSLVMSDGARLQNPPAAGQNPVTREPQGAPVPAPGANAGAQADAARSKPAVVADPDGQVVKSEKQTFKIEVVAREIETPWAIAFLPDRRLLITERPGRLRIVEKGKLLPEAVKGTPKVWEKQDGGLLDVEVHPQYAKNGWIYLSYSEIVPDYVAPPPPPPGAEPPTPPPAAQQGRGRGRGGPPDPPTMTVIVRGKISKNNEWTDQQVIFRGKPEIYSSTNAHYGSRFIF